MSKMTFKETHMHLHLWERYMDSRVHHPWVSDDTAVFFLYNLSGQLTGFQQYRPAAYKTTHNNAREGRYFTYVSKGHCPVFGFETFNLDTKVVFVTEGVFDAVRLTRKGVCALAVLSNDPMGSTKNLLLSLGVPLVAVCDRDKAGQKLGNFCHYKVTVPEPFKDLGDASEEWVEFLVKKFHN